MTAWDAVTQIVGTLVIAAAVAVVLLAIGYQWQQIRREHRAQRRFNDTPARVIHLPSQSSNCRVIDLTDQRPIA